MAGRKEIRKCPRAALCGIAHFGKHIISKGRYSIPSAINAPPKPVMARVARMPTPIAPRLAVVTPARASVCNLADAVAVLKPVAKPTNERA